MGSFKNSLQSSASVSTFNLTPSLFMVEPSSEPVITIDSDTRQISIPKELYNVGVTGDHVCETIYFKLPRYFDGKDLSEHTCVIRFINAGSEYGETDKNDIVDLTIDDEFITFGWKIDNRVTRYKGIIEFTVQFETKNNNIIEYQWQTTPAQLNILAGLNIEKTITEKDDILFRSLTNQIDSLQDQVKDLENRLASAELFINKINQLSKDVDYIKENVVYVLDEV